MEFWKIWKIILKKIKLRIEFRKIKFKKIRILENWNFEKLFLKVNLRVEFWKLNIENWNLGKIILKMEFQKIKFKKKIEILENWNFDKNILKSKFDNRISKN